MPECEHGFDPETCVRCAQHERGATAMAEQRSSTLPRRRRQWCYECQRYMFVRPYPTHLLEEVITLCDGCAVDLEYAEEGSP